MKQTDNEKGVTGTGRGMVSMNMNMSQVVTVNHLKSTSLLGKFICLSFRPCDILMYSRRPVTTLSSPSHQEVCLSPLFLQVYIQSRESFVSHGRGQIPLSK